MIGRDEDVNSNARVQMLTLVAENIRRISIFREHNIFAIGDGLAKFAKILCTRKNCDLQYMFMSRIVSTLLLQLVDRWYKSIDKESFLMARRMIREEGLLCGELPGCWYGSHSLID